MSVAATTAGVINNGVSNAGQLEFANQQQRAAGGPEASALDVWRHTGEGLTRPMGLGEALLHSTPAGAAVGTFNSLSEGMHSSSFSGIGDAMSSQWSQMGTDLANIGKAKGALATVGATFALLTSLEQTLSAALSFIPFPALPAVRILDMDVGLPHAHMHPPNLIPPAPPVPLPSTGPVIPIPFLSGASKTVINGMPAARCGDMGLGIWCGGYFPMYEIFLGSSNVWVEGCRAARVGVDITKHCIFTSPKPQDPPAGPMIGFTVTASPNVVIGGIPMPSLLNLAMGAMFKALFKGVSKVINKIRAHRLAKEAGEAVPMFSKGNRVATKPRPVALKEVMDEIKAKGIEVRCDDESIRYLDASARMQGLDPSQVHAVALGDDLIIVRPEHMDNPRILREELIHTDQARAGDIASNNVVQNEIAARQQMIEHADDWGITSDEVAEMQREIDIMNQTGRY